MQQRGAIEMLVKELQFFLKRNRKIAVLVFFQLFAFLLLCGIFIEFLYMLDIKSSDAGQYFDGKTVYQIIDDYYDGEAFDKFNQAEDALSDVKAFYEGLDHASDFQYITMTDQFVEISKPDIPQNFIPNGFPLTEAAEYKPVRSFQINERGISYFGLGAASGRIWQNADFAEPAGSIPVLLGANYTGTFQLGEKVKVRYYQKIMDAQVVGFLHPNSKVFYFNDPEFYLDDYFIMPYVNWGNPVSAADSIFQKICYFAMVNRFVITEKNELAVQRMMQSIDIISQEAGGFQYSFVGMNPQLLRYNWLVSILRANETMLKGIFLWAFVLNVIITALLLYMQQKKQEKIYIMHLFHGASAGKMFLLKLSEVLIMIGSSYSMYYIVMSYALKIGEVRTHFYILGICILMAAVLTMSLLYQLLRRPIAYYLSDND